MADAVWTALRIGAFYPIICLIIALVRALLSRRGRRAANFRSAFWEMFIEIMNPLDWL